MLGGVGGCLGGLGRCGLGRRCRLRCLHGHGLFGHRCASLVRGGQARARGRRGRRRARPAPGRRRAAGRAAGARTSSTSVPAASAARTATASGPASGGTARRAATRRSQAVAAWRPPGPGPRTPVQPGAALQRLDRAHRHRQRLAHQGAEPPGPPQQGEHRPRRPSCSATQPTAGGRARQRGWGPTSGACSGSGTSHVSAGAGTEQPQREGGVGVLVEVGVAQHVGLPEHGEVARRLDQRTRPAGCARRRGSRRWPSAPARPSRRASRAGGPGRGRRGAGRIDGARRLDARGPDADAERRRARSASGSTSATRCAPRAGARRSAGATSSGCTTTTAAPAAGDRGRVA